MACRCVSLLPSLLQLALARHADAALARPQAYSRRHDPLAAVHAARNPGLAASQHSQQQQYGASALPPLELDIMSIASQLREHDARRGSEDVRGGEVRLPLSLFLGRNGEMLRD